MPYEVHTPNPEYLREELKAAFEAFDYGQVQARRWKQPSPGDRSILIAYGAEKVMKAVAMRWGFTQADKKDLCAFLDIEEIDSHPWAACIHA